MFQYFLFLSKRHLREQPRLEEDLKLKAVVVAEKAQSADIFAEQVGKEKANVQAESEKAAVEASPQLIELYRGPT